MTALTQLAGPRGGLRMEPRGQEESGRARLALAASPSAEPIPWTLRILAGAPAPVSMQTVTWRPAGSAGHLLMRVSGGIPGPQVGEGPIRCAAQRCQVESQVACPAGWGPGPWQERGKLAGCSWWVSLPEAALRLPWKGRPGSSWRSCPRGPRNVPGSWACPLLLPLFSQAGRLLGVRGEGGECSRERPGEGIPESL